MYMCVYMSVYMYMCVGGAYFVCWDLSQTCGPPGPGEDTGEFSFTLWPPHWFQKDSNPAGMFALLDKDRMHNGAVGDNLALPRVSVCEEG